MKTKILVSLAAVTVSFSAFAGGGPHDLPLRCKAGETKIFPARYFESIFTDLSGSGEISNGNFFSVTLGVEYEGRVMQQNGDCEAQVLKAGSPRLFVAIQENTARYEIVRKERLSTDKSIGRQLQLIRNSSNDVVGAHYIDLAAGDNFSLLCDLSSHNRPGIGRLTGVAHGVSVENKAVDCREGVREGIPHDINN